MKTEAADYAGEKYDKSHNDFKTRARICDRIICDDNFTSYEKIELTPFKDNQIAKKNYIAVQDSKKICGA